MIFFFPPSQKNPSRCSSVNLQLRSWYYCSLLNAVCSVERRSLSHPGGATPQKKPFLLFWLFFFSLFPLLKRVTRETKRRLQYYYNKVLDFCPSFIFIFWTPGSHCRPVEQGVTCDGGTTVLTLVDSAESAVSPLVVVHAKADGSWWYSKTYSRTCTHKKGENRCCG